MDVAVVGLGFGEAFLPAYLAHPRVGRVGVVEPDPSRLTAVADRYGIRDRFSDLDTLLATDEWDAVHLLTPVPTHARLAEQVLRSGRHCACAVPMGLELEDLDRVLAATRESGRRYLMMETQVFGREHLLVEQLLRDGELGPITHYRGFHTQDLDGFPEYWRGYPPLKYATHALAPLLALTGTTVADVVAHGSGRLTPERTGVYDNPFPVETGLFRLHDSDVVGSVTMSFFQVARGYVEGFCVYGEQRSLEWSGVDGDPLVLHEIAPTTAGRGRATTSRTIHPPDHGHRLPAPLRPLVATSAHGGSHPYLVHELVEAVLDGRPSLLDAPTTAAWTAAGICAHASALRGGERIAVPTYTRR